MSVRTLPLAIVLLIAPLSVQAQDRLPVIDVHLHKLSYQAGLEEPLTGFKSPETPEQLREQTIAELDRFNIVKTVASEAGIHQAPQVSVGARPYRRVAESGSTEPFADEFDR